MFPELMAQMIVGFERLHFSELTIVDVTVLRANCINRTRLCAGANYSVDCDRKRGN